MVGNHPFLFNQTQIYEKNYACICTAYDTKIRRRSVNQRQTRLRKVNNEKVPARVTGWSRSNGMSHPAFLIKTNTMKI